MNFCQVESRTVELAALESLKNCCVVALLASSFFILVGNQDMHNDEFEFRSDPTMH